MSPNDDTRRMSRCIDILVLSSNHDKIADRASGGLAAVLRSHGQFGRSHGQTGVELWSNRPGVLVNIADSSDPSCTALGAANECNALPRNRTPSPIRALPAGIWGDGRLPGAFRSGGNQLPETGIPFFAARRSPFQGGTLVNSGEPWSIPERRGPCGANSGQSEVGERRARSNSSCSKAEAMSSCSLRRRPNRDASLRQPLTTAATSATISRAAEGVIP